VADSAIKKSNAENLRRVPTYLTHLLDTKNLNLTTAMRIKRNTRTNRGEESIRCTQDMNNVPRDAHIKREGGKIKGKEIRNLVKRTSTTSPKALNRLPRKEKKIQRVRGPGVTSQKN
jgi:hypothetical protein